GVPLACAVVGIAVTILLTFVSGWYPVLMVGLPGNPTSNMAPPDVALLTHAVGMIGLVLLARPWINRWLRSARAWGAVVYGHSIVMTLFCWHLTAVFIVQGVLLLLGVRPPPSGTAGWWAVLPLWMVACAMPLAVLVVLFGWAERSPSGTPAVGGVGRTAAA